MNRAPSLFVAAVLAAGGLCAQDPEIPPDKEPVTTESGLKYSVLKEGEGQSPEMGDVVRVNYTGWLPNGKVFDASSRHGGPLKFTLGNVIEGWNEGLQLMRPGARYKLTIPYELAYGEQGQGPIPPKSTLIFDVELLDVVKRHPKFQPIDPDKAKQVDSLLVQVVQEGQGEPPAADTPVEMEVAAFNEKGDLLQWTGEGPLQATPQHMQLPVLREVAKKMKPGAVWLVKAPPEMAWGQRDLGEKLPPGSTTVWRIALPRVYREPKFEKPDLDAMQTTESGLKYRVLREGEGKSPAPTDRVTVHYVGRLMDGTEFDSSYENGQPATFPLNQVIAGWTEGLQLMKPGAHYRFVIPAKLGYGESGSPPKIPGGATLVFDVELLSVQ